jgi:hypothetical protein
MIMRPSVRKNLSRRVSWRSHFRREARLAPRTCNTARTQLNAVEFGPCLRRISMRAWSSQLICSRPSRCRPDFPPSPPHSRKPPRISEKRSVSAEQQGAAEAKRSPLSHDDVISCCVCACLDLRTGVHGRPPRKQGSKKIQQFRLLSAVGSNPSHITSIMTRQLVPGSPQKKARSYCSASSQGKPSRFRRTQRGSGYP